MSFNQHMGLHLRLNKSLSQLVQTAELYKLSLFQFFLVAQNTDKYITLTNSEKEYFVKARKHFSDIFIHSSYWINAASSNKNVFTISKNLLQREINLAKKLDIEYLVLHPGSAKGHKVTDLDPYGKKKGIETLASMLNSLLKKEHNVKILLENSAHGRGSIGNDFHDFTLIKQALDAPEKVGFCVDFAHAFSFGYDLEPVDNFIQLLDKTMDINSIKLIHFNDTLDARGSMQDRHAFPGQGAIGASTLQKLLHHPLLKTVPKIIEGPEKDNESNFSALQAISHWF